MVDTKTLTQKYEDFTDVYDGSFKGNQPHSGPEARLPKYMGNITFSGFGFMLTAETKNRKFYI